ncbi:hypothetical protein [Mangrovitalea sediminis]|uniref:hypothetical protein n=1 Tax=Mangrovitalea sediminis TaxID=1982043 RepID=UPI0011785571|nr:hypothetical protein [Mangrovitalea sediminis]
MSFRVREVGGCRGMAVRLSSVGLSLLLAATAGCASLQGTPSPAVAKQHNQRAMAAFDQYMGCMQAAAQRYAPAQATAFEIAAAAQADCHGAFIAYKHGYEKYLQSLVSPASADFARSSADKHVEESRQQARDRVVQIVVEARLPSHNSAQPKP